jgi:hypothetical protein
VVADRLARIGLDADTVERELAAERPENERLLGKLKADAVAQSGTRAATLRKQVDDYAADLGDLVATTGHTDTHYVTLDTPDEIWTYFDAPHGQQHLDVVSSAREPYHSYAKARLDVTASIWHDDLIFSYSWQNPSPNEYAVATVSAILVLNGFCTTHSEGGFLATNTAGLRLYGDLGLIPSWMASRPLYQDSQWVDALNLHSDSDGLFADDHTNTEAIFRGWFLSYEQLFIPPGQEVRIDVTLMFYTFINGGTVNADFATGELSVQSPLVQLAYVTA